MGALYARALPVGACASVKHSAVVAGSPAAILEGVEATPWDALAAPFAPTALSWRIVRLSPDQLSAQVRPQLPAAVIAARLDAVLGVEGWSHNLAALGERGLVCTLSVAGAYKSAAVAYSAQTGVAEAAEDALAAAAAFFGLCPPVALAELPWVDYDAEQGQILYEPELPETELPEPELPGGVEPVPVSVPSPVPGSALEENHESPPPAPASAKSAGQQAIDKLVDRLKAEGRGLQAAKLLTSYGGYGGDPAAARELYAKLRELLLGRAGERAE